MDHSKFHKTIAFDIDGTLCSLSNGQYELATPYHERIAHVNYLKSRGTKILIFTARGVTSGRDLREFTMRQLADWGLQYDELIMGKPHFDLLIDDKVSNVEVYFGSDND